MVQRSRAGLEAASHTGVDHEAVGVDPVRIVGGEGEITFAVAIHVDRRVDEAPVGGLVERLSVGVIGPCHSHAWT